MKSYKILKFKQEHVDYKLDNVTGFYVTGNGKNEIKRGLVDLVSLGGIKITSIKDDKRNITISIDDRRTKTISINAIYFQQNKPYLSMSNGAEMPVEEFTHYKEVVEKPIEAKGVKKDPIKEIEDKILQQFKENPIRLEKTLLKTARAMGLEKFMVKFFKEWNLEKDTIFAKDKTVHTVKAKRRSLGDIYMICKYYYPNCTLKEVLNILYNKLENIITDGFRTSSCRKIHKRVWYYDNKQKNQKYNEEELDEFGYDYNFYLKNSK